MKFIFQGCQKKHVRVAISQKGLYEKSQDAPHFKGFWNPDWLAPLNFTEVKVTLEVNCDRRLRRRVWMRITRAFLPLTAWIWMDGCDSPWENLDRFTLMYIYRSLAYSVRLSGIRTKRDKRTLFWNRSRSTPAWSRTWAHENVPNKKQEKDCGESEPIVRQKCLKLDVISCNLVWIYDHCGPWT